LYQGFVQKQITGKKMGFDIALLQKASILNTELQKKLVPRRRL
jgi:hypothetical protein